MSKVHTAIIVFVTIIVGCNRLPDENRSDTDAETDDISLQYVGAGEGGGGTHGANPPFGACALTAPGETVVLAKATRDFEATLYQPCDANRAIYSTHIHTGLEILRQSGPPVSDVLQDTIWFPSISDVNVDANTPAGTTVLASLRQAGEDWIVMAAVVVEPTSMGEAVQEEAFTYYNRPIALPTEWSDIVSQTSQAQTEYATACDENPHYLDGTRLMSAEEFETFIHTPQVLGDCGQDAGRNDF